MILHYKCSFRACENEERNFFGNFNILSKDFDNYIQKLEEIFVKNFKKNYFQKNMNSYLLQLDEI